MEAHMKRLSICLASMVIACAVSAACAESIWIPDLLKKLSTKFRVKFIYSENAFYDSFGKKLTISEDLEGMQIDTALEVIRTVAVCEIKRTARGLYLVKKDFPRTDVEAKALQERVAELSDKVESQGKTIESQAEEIDKAKFTIESLQKELRRLRGLVKGGSPD
jgi:peptidoglycan hydrolase CwlO-like protein